MLTNTVPLSHKECNSKAYIKETIKEEDPELEFRGIEGGKLTNVMTTRVMKYLVKVVKATDRVSELHLNGCKLTDEMMKQLSQGKLSHLDRLSLHNNQLTSLSVEYLSRGGWRNLRSLDIGNNPMLNINGRLLSSAVPPSIEELSLSKLELHVTCLK